MPSIDEIEFNTDLITSSTRDVGHFERLTWVKTPGRITAVQVENSPDVIAKDNIGIESTSNP